MSTESTQLPSAGASVSSNGGKHSGKPSVKRPIPWWHKIKEIDPITFEPIASMRHEPFGLLVRDEMGDKVLATHYFDGEMLARYMTSTGNFMNPNTRQELTREECLELDAYLVRNRLQRFNVAEAFAAKMHVLATSARHGAHGNQSGAAVLMGSLFQFPRYERRNRGLVHQSGGLTVIDNDHSFNFASESEPDLANVEEFPSIATALQHPAPVSTSHELQWRGRVTPPRSLPGESDFPTLGQSTGRASTPNPSWRLHVGSSSITVPRSSKKERSRLNLKPQTISQRANGGSRATAIFGNAKPREDTLAKRGIDWKELDSDHSRKSHLKKMAKTDSTTTPMTLCPYPPKLLLNSLLLGVSFVSHLEGVLRDFILAAPSVQTLVPDLEPKSKAALKFMKDLCIYYYGLDITVLEEGARLRVSKSSSGFIPGMTIARALTEFSHIIDEQNDPDFLSLPNLTLGDSCSIALWNVQASTGSRPSGAKICDALSEHVRQSEVTLHFVGNDNRCHVIAELAVPSVRARKIFTKLQSQRGHLGAGITCNEVQWWPAGKEFADHQIRFMTRLLKQSVANQKEEQHPRIETEEDPIELEREEIVLGVRATGWDDDNDGDFAIKANLSLDQEENFSS